MRRSELTDLIITAKVHKKVSWADIAIAVGASKEWVTAGCLGQMTFNEEQARCVAKLFDLPEEALELLQVPPSRGSSPAPIPVDPLVYRFYEMISVYGTTFAQLIHEEFGDGIMSAVDFKVDVRRQQDPTGDRVSITMSGKFLPYRQF